MHRKHWLFDLLAQRKTPLALLLKGLFYLAPRPVLEPGTYGLTESRDPQKSLEINDLQDKKVNV